VVQSLVYLGRLFAAMVLIFVALVVASVAVTTPKGRELSFGVAAVFGIAGAFAWPRRPNAWRRDPPTDRQIAFARDLGITIPNGISKGELSDLISEAKQIRDAF
jgi:hypothetical protein